MQEALNIEILQPLNRSEHLNDALLQIKIKKAVREAFMINLLYLLADSGKIALFLWVYLGSEEICNGPLYMWIWLMFIHDVTYFLTLLKLLWNILRVDAKRFSFENNPNPRVNESGEESYQNIDIALHSHARQMVDNSEHNGFHVNQILEKNDRFLSVFMEICRLFYFVLFVYGNVVFFSDSLCKQEKTPFYFTLALVYILMGIIYLIIPILVFSIFCFCLPFILIFFLYTNLRNPQRDARERLIKSLVSFKYRDDLYVKECCICMMEFNAENDLIELPCNSNHIFHGKCIKEWLTINGGCPICRSKLNPNENEDRYANE